MKKLSLIILMLASWCLQATHNRAGEITYRHIDGLTYELRITTYTRSCQFCADRCSLTINWGDSSSTELSRVNGLSVRCRAANDGVIIDPANEIRKNIYIGQHTYQAPGIYTIWFEDPNRNAGINNIINSDLVPFYLESELFISPSLGPNNSPILTNPPVDQGCKNRRFEHSAGAFDPDGDSLAYSLVPSKSTGGQDINTIYDPQYVQDSVRISGDTGLFIWDLPRDLGQFNFAFKISEYRKNAQGRYVRIGYIIRDFQVDIEDCGNNPPKIDPLGPFCVEAGERLNFDVTARDVDDDPVELSAFGGPYEVPSPADSFGGKGPQPLTESFRWDTECLHVRKKPYPITFKVEDDPPDPTETSLSSFRTTDITVIAPAPKNPSAQADNAAINLQWEPSICTDAQGYTIYRREGTFGFFPDDCETGVPAYTGYTLLDSNDQGLADTSYVDTNELQVGVQYCYMVVAYFEDGAESYASEEFCAALPLSLPLFTHVDVDSTSQADGVIEVAWIPPPELDSSLFPPPYEYELFRAEGINGANYNSIASFTSLKDTNYTDEGLNTLEQGYRYRLDFLYGPNAEKAGSASKASSVYLVPRSGDKSVKLQMTNNTAWQNKRFLIAREIPQGSGNFDSVAQSFVPEYRDTGLINGEEYCYRVTSYGRYSASDSLPAPLINRSQITCAAARDTSAPCTPELSLVTACPDTVIFSWSFPQDPSCIDDLKQVNIYFKPPGGDFGETPFRRVPTSGDSTILFINDGEAFGCFAISAEDDADQDPGGEANESPLSSEVCLESCFTIDFPNVFTPNGDGTNDFFGPTTFNQLAYFRLDIYDRWGKRVYHAKSIEEAVNPGWNGTFESTGNPAPEGVYYYLARYRAQSLGQAREQSAKGFIHLFR